MVHLGFNGLVLLFWADTFGWGLGLDNLDSGLVGLGLSLVGRVLGLARQNFVLSGLGSDLAGLGLGLISGLDGSAGLSFRSAGLTITAAVRQASVLVLGLVSGTASGLFLCRCFLQSRLFWGGKGAIG